MSSVERRVRKLELVHDSGSRLIVVATGADHKDGEVDALLAEKGIQVTDRDLVVCVRTRVDAKAADRPSPELLYARDL